MVIEELDDNELTALVQYITRVTQSPLVLVKGKLENTKELPVH